MKPTPGQIKLAQYIESQASWWQTTNDIRSPTHYCDISNDLADLVFEEVITEEEAKEIEKTMEVLYELIKAIKK